MKTTIEIADALLDEARIVAAREGISLDVLIEQGLRQVIFASQPWHAFHLRKASFKGHGLNPAVKPLYWRQLRDPLID